MSDDLETYPALEAPKWIVISGGPSSNGTVIIIFDQGIDSWTMGLRSFVGSPQEIAEDFFVVVIVDNTVPSCVRSV
jgi:hypothetical protein